MISLFAVKALNAHHLDFDSFRLQSLFLVPDAASRQRNKIKNHTFNSLTTDKIIQLIRKDL